MKEFAIALGLNGKMFDNLQLAWEILGKEMNIKYVSSRSPKPHIAISTGVANNDLTLIKILKNINLKKFKIDSAGLGVFVNVHPLLYLRWEQNKSLLKLFNMINKKTSTLLSNKSKFYNSSLWLPKTTIAWKDFKYSQLELVINKINFLSKNNHANVCSLDLYKLTKNKEIILEEFSL